MKVKLLKKLRRKITCEYDPNKKKYILKYKDGNNECYREFGMQEVLFSEYRKTIIYYAKYYNSLNLKARNRIKPNIEIKHAQKHEL